MVDGEHPALPSRWISQLPEVATPGLGADNYVRLSFWGLRVVFVAGWLGSGEGGVNRG